ncbi:MAG: shikimate dehydrogenase family protein [Actinomycetota bacterium]
MTSSSRDLMLFIGVTTGGSSIMRLFPIWSEVLGLHAQIEGRDLEIGGPPEIYRSVVDEIRGSDELRGALVTTHKMDIFRHAHDMFEDLDKHARLCREVSSISKRGSRLVAHAKDPITAGRALERILGDRSMPSDVLCLGAGGAGTAITVYLLGLPNRPRRIVVTDRSEDRVNHLRAVHSEMGVSGGIEYRVTQGAADHDVLLGSMGAGSLIVNATGMGKDTPGSPLGDDAEFPEKAIVWELNYRGELDFMKQAQRNGQAGGLELHDGWVYFLYGWAEVMAEVFDFSLSDARFETLATAASSLRP